VSGVLAVDLGGTNMRVAVVAADGTILHRRTEPTPKADQRPTAFVSLIASELRGAACRDAGVDHAVIGLPGRIDHRARELEMAPNLPQGWIPALKERALEAALQTDVLLANDADLAAVGEAYFGAGRGFGDVAYVTISTGIGAGVVLKGKIVHGRRSLAELGHTIIDLAAAGRGDLAHATVENLGSGTALGRNAAEAGLTVSGKALVDLVRLGDPAAREVFGRTINAAAVGIVNLCHLFSPEIVVIGGGLGRNGSLVLDPVRIAIARLGPVGLDDDPIEVAEAALGDDAALIGAAAWRRAL
jgi:glucokinase